MGECLSSDAGLDANLYSNTVAWSVFGGHGSHRKNNILMLYFPSPMILPFVRERQSILGLQIVASYKFCRAVKFQQNRKKQFVSWACYCPWNFVFQRCQSSSLQKELKML